MESFSTNSQLILENTVKTQFRNILNHIDDLDHIKPEILQAITELMNKCKDELIYAIRNSLKTCTIASSILYKESNQMSDIQEWDCSIEAHKVFQNFVAATTLLYASKRLISESPKPKFSLSEYDPKKVLKVEYYNLIFSNITESILCTIMNICK